MSDVVVYVHGKGGDSSECVRYRSLFPASEVVGLTYQADSPREAERQIFETVEGICGRRGRVTLVAVSIGAFFSMCARIDRLVHRAYFMSPIVDLESLILQMMARGKVTEEELCRREVISTPSGDLLSWDYLTQVRKRPVRWEVATKILYGSEDNLSSYAAIAEFASAHGASLTVMDGGEHWFHTEEQMRFLDAWVARCERGTGGVQEVGTRRLLLYPATQEQVAAMIAAEPDPDMAKAYREMLAGACDHPGQEEWYLPWLVDLVDGTHIGDLCFKGLSGNGTTEVGYGILGPYRGRGYATEAVAAMTRWALGHQGVRLVEAETEPGNVASQRVLAKCGFVSTGAVGAEGPRFVCQRCPS